MLYAGEARQNLDGTTSVKILSTITPRKLQELGIMATVKAKTSRKISLVLDLEVEEAETLMAMMQNPVNCQQYPHEEQPIEAAVRYAIFDALHAEFYGNQRGVLTGAVQLEGDGPPLGNRRLPHDTKDASDLFPPPLERIGRGSGIMEG